LAAEQAAHTKITMRVDDALDDEIADGWVRLPERADYPASGCRRAAGSDMLAA
jgi:hypothetical protein